MSAAALKALKVIIAILKGDLKDTAEKAGYLLLIIGTAFIFLLILVIMPVVIHERVPVAMTKQQALWYWQAAKDVTEMTQVPCDAGVYVDWQQVIAIDTVRLKQNFSKSSANRANKLAKMFVEKKGTCTYCTGKGKNRVCTDYDTYRLKSIDEVMNELGMSSKDQKTVKEKYLAIRYDFLIGFDNSKQDSNQTGDISSNYDGKYAGEIKWPLSGHTYVSCPYGYRIHPITHKRSFHYGIDIPAPVGTIVQAPADGVIKSYTWSSIEGWCMLIDHGINDRGERVETRYCHLSANIASVGQKVKTGDPVAKSGNTGAYTTGAHLHFEVHINGVTRNPMDYAGR